METLLQAMLSLLLFINIALSVTKVPAAGAVILTLNVLLLGAHIIFFQSISLLGYCLFPLVVGALICLLGIQRHHQDDGGVGNMVMEFLGCITFNEHCCVLLIESLGPVLSFSFVYLRCLFDHCHRLRRQEADRYRGRIYFVLLGVLTSINI